MDDIKQKEAESKGQHQASEQKEHDKGGSGGRKKSSDNGGTGQGGKMKRYVQFINTFWFKFLTT